ncbi:MAG: hypothetical protein R3F04_09070 [Lysobacteraceae bacterium]
MFDDYFNLQPVRDWFNGQRYASEVIFGNSSGILGRPVSMLSFLSCLRVLGRMRLCFYKLGNLALHIGIALLVVNITRRLIALAKPELPAWWAWLAGALWALHPLHVSTVLYSVQRMAQLSTLAFVVGGAVLLNSAAAMQSGRTRPGWLVVAGRNSLLVAWYVQQGERADSAGATLVGFPIASARSGR